MPTVQTCPAHAECVLVDGVHTPGHPRAPDAPLVRDVEKAEKAAGERLRVAGARTRRLRHELGPAVASLQEKVRDAEDRVRLLVQGTGAQIETALADLTDRLSNRERTFLDTAKAALVTTANAVRTVADARQEMADEYASFTAAVDEERVRLASARHAFTEKAERASQDLREEAKEVVRAAHEELKELAKTKEALEREVRDLMRTAQAVSA